ncbi:peptidylprolyl isomerase [Aestuariispira insulae]|nr:peptidylprolyl isomerase [Aestuariispira insulae]
MTKKTRAISSFLLLATMALSSLAILNTARAQSLKIVAVVNDEIISYYDLESRIRMTIQSSQMQDTPATRQRLAREVLKVMIDESLKRQAGEEKNIQVREKEIDEQISYIEKNNGMTPGSLMKFFQASRIDPETLKSQIRAQIIWNKLIGRTMRRRVNVGEEEIDEQLAVLESKSELIQKRVFEIYLSMDTPDDESQVKEEIERIRNQLAAGANFTEIARNFSQAQTAALGGDKGWVLPSELPDELQQAVANLKAGEVSRPIETLTGMYLLKVTGERRLGGEEKDASIELAQISLPLNQDQGARDTILAQLNGLRDKIDSCDASPAAAKTLEGASSSRTGMVKVSNLAGNIQKVVADLEIGQTSEPVALSKAAMIFTLCRKQEAKSNLPSRRDIREQLTQARLELLARQYLRDLRHSAFIDVRL